MAHGSKKAVVTDILANSIVTVIKFMADMRDNKAEAALMQLAKEHHEVEGISAMNSEEPLAEIT